MIEGEEIIQCYGLLLDFACLTNKRLFFVNASINGKKKVVSVPYKNIDEVFCDYGHLRGEVEIYTKQNKYELKMGTGLADKFANDILTQMFNN